MLRTGWIVQLIVGMLLATPGFADDVKVPVARLQAIADAYATDTGALRRVSRIRSLSLLTVAEIGRARLFLGVNNRGVAGLHFGTLPHRVDFEPEILRMPYLRQTKLRRGTDK